MNNNLNIENLIKTEWFNQFDKKQRRIIEEGLEKNLDVSIYTKKEFDEHQMAQIRVGLEIGLDVSIYAKSELTWKQMKQIRIELLKENKNNE